VNEHGAILPSVMFSPKRTCEADAIYIPGNPRLGAQETSLTQSSWPRITSSSLHFLASSSYSQTRTILSEPPETKRFWLADCGWPCLAGRTEGAQEIAFAPVPCAAKTDASVEPSF
jgi:hypothetical protein